MEMVIQGVSTRKVAEITKKLCGTTFSKSTVSALCSNLDDQVLDFNRCPLTQGYAFAYADATLFGLVFLASEGLGPISDRRLCPYNWCKF